MTSHARFMTEIAKQYALVALEMRRAIYKNAARIDNASLRAGQPMYYYCTECNAPIEVPEDWTTRPYQCPQCLLLKDQGWL